MNRLREYSWKDWINVPKNKELYNSNMNEGLRQFQLEKNQGSLHNLNMIQMVVYLKSQDLLEEYLPINIT